VATWVPHPTVPRRGRIEKKQNWRERVTWKTRVSEPRSSASRSSRICWVWVPNNYWVPWIPNSRDYLFIFSTSANWFI
jgi:hypothetical protein